MSSWFFAVLTVLTLTRTNVLVGAPPQPMVAEDPEVIAQLLQQVTALVKDGGKSINRNYQEIEDADDFVSPFSKGRADKSKFFALKGLDYRKTVTAIRKDGVDVFFIDLEKGFRGNELARDFNDGVNRDLLQILENAFKFHSRLAKEKRSLEMIALYSNPTRPTYDLNGNELKVPTARPYIVVNLNSVESIDNLTELDLYMLQHEYLHHLFESRRVNFSTSQDQLTKQANTLVLKGREIERALNIGKGKHLVINQGNAPAVRELWVTKLDLAQAAGHLAMVKSIKEWDAIWVQLKTKKEMGMSDELAASLLEYVFLTTSEIAREINKTGQDQDIPVMIQNPDLLGIEGLKSLVEVLRRNLFLAQCAKRSERFMNSADNQALLRIIAKRNEAGNKDAEKK